MVPVWATRGVAATTSMAAREQTVRTACERRICFMWNVPPLGKERGSTSGLPQTLFFSHYLGLHLRRWTCRENRQYDQSTRGSGGRQGYQFQLFTSTSRLPESQF